MQDLPPSQSWQNYSEWHLTKTIQNKKISNTLSDLFKEWKWRVETGKELQLMVNKKLFGTWENYLEFRRSKK